MMILFQETGKYQCFFFWIKQQLERFVYFFFDKFHAIFTTVTQYKQVTLFMSQCYPQCHLNPLIPNIHMQILQSHLRTFPWRISCENLIKDHSISLMTTVSILLTFLSWRRMENVRRKLMMVTIGTWRVLTLKNVHTCNNL